MVSLLSRWCQVREDLLFAFEKSLAAGLANPLRQAVADLIIRVRSGMPVDEALDLMKAGIDHENFRDLITAVRFNFRHRGDLPALLEQMEMQLHRIEEEYDRRRLSNARDFRLTSMILILVPLFFACRLLGNPATCRLFLANPLGLAILPACLALYLIAVACLLAIHRRITG